MSGLIRTTQKTAVRRHKNPCDACELPVIPGDQFVEQYIAEDGYTYTWKAHQVCMDVLYRVVDDADQEEGMQRGCLRGDYHDHEDLTPEWRDWYRQRKAMGVQP